MNEEARTRNQEVYKWKSGYKNKQSIQVINRKRRVYNSGRSNQLGTEKRNYGQKEKAKSGNFHRWRFDKKEIKETEIFKRNDKEG